MLDQNSDKVSLFRHVSISFEESNDILQCSTIKSAHLATTNCGFSNKPDFFPASSVWLCREKVLPFRSCLLQLYCCCCCWCSEGGDSIEDGCEDDSVVGSWIGSGRVNLFSTAKSHLGVSLLGVHLSNSMPESGEIPLLNGPSSSIAAWVHLHSTSKQVQLYLPKCVRGPLVPRSCG